MDGYIIHGSQHDIHEIWDSIPSDDTRFISFGEFVKYFDEEIAPKQNRKFQYCQLIY